MLHRPDTRPEGYTAPFKIYLHGTAAGSAGNDYRAVFKKDIVCRTPTAPICTAKINVSQFEPVSRGTLLDYPRAIIIAKDIAAAFYLCNGIVRERHPPAVRNVCTQNVASFPIETGDFIANEPCRTRHKNHALCCTAIAQSDLVMDYNAALTDGNEATCP